MTSVGFSFGDRLAWTLQAGQDDLVTPVTAVQPGKGTVGEFGTALEKAQRLAQLDPAAVPVAPPANAVTQTRPAAATEGTVGNPGADARERARRALGLEAPVAPATANQPAGDAIIEGMQKLRGVFDQQTSRLNSISSSKNFDIGSLMSMQMEMVRFSLLVEVTSKLTGKSTQAFDTLMKGQ
jgi:type III secretion system YscI/HrpB-like protein